MGQLPRFDLVAICSGYVSFSSNARSSVLNSTNGWSGFDWTH